VCVCVCVYIPYTCVRVTRVCVASIYRVYLEVFQVKYYISVFALSLTLSLPLSFYLSLPLKLVRLSLGPRTYTRRSIDDTDLLYLPSIDSLTPLTAASGGTRVRIII